MKKKVQLLLLAAVLVFTMLLIPVTSVKASSTERDDLNGCIVILFSNDVHGEVDGYAYMAGLEDYFRELKADMILVDTGDYSQGSPYVNTSKGAAAVELMNTVDYDVVSLGSHEFDYGYAQLGENLEEADFDVVCANVFDSNGQSVFQNNTIVERGGVKIGFFGLVTPETQTKGNPANTSGLTFASGQDLYDVAQAQVNELKSNGADIVICLSQLGVDEESEPNSSYNILENTTGIDMIFDGHSHTMMEEGVNGEPIMQSGTAFETVGAVLIEESTKKIENNALIELKERNDNEVIIGWYSDLNYLIDEQRNGKKDVNDAVSALKGRIDDLYAAEFAETETDLNGDENANQTGETNLGDLIADSMLWKAIDGNGISGVDSDHIIAITNGGGISAGVDSGKITRNDLHEVLPDGNTISVIYLTGRELLEALEASTYNMPDAVTAFPQVSGMEIEIDTTRTYDANDTVYPGTNYYGPKSINRVTIKSINGKPFDESETYAVVTNSFLAAGGDTYYAFTNATDQFDTGIPMDEALMEYIENELEGEISQEVYGSAEGRIKVVTSHTISSEKVEAVYDCENGGHIAYYPCLDEGCDAKFADPEGTVKYEESEIVIAPKGQHKIETVGAVEATDTKDGYTGDKKCTECGKIVEKGEVIPALGNKDADKETDKNADKETDKNTDKDTDSDAGKEKTSDSVSPATGDTMDSPILLIMLMLAAVSAMCVCSCKKNGNVR